MSSPANGSTNGSANDSVYLQEASATIRHNLRPDPIQQIIAVGIGRSSDSEDLHYSPNGRDFWFEKPYFPGQPKSLSGIATRAFCLGLLLSASIICFVYLLFFTASPFWRPPFFFAALALFHFLEFWTTARYNTRAAQVGSFLISQNGSAYQLSHAAASFECLITTLFFPNRHWVPPTLARFLVLVGFALVIIGQIIRSAAMIQAGSNFNHLVQYQKSREHQLVTTGVYGYLRHPSYFGFFWWALGTQLVLGNVVCLVGYVAVLWKFFSKRILGKWNEQFLARGYRANWIHCVGEEEFLVAFFGDDYIKYRQKTGVWIPFIQWQSQRLKEHNRARVKAFRDLDHWATLYGRREKINVMLDNHQMRSVGLSSSDIGYRSTEVAK